MAEEIHELAVKLTPEGAGETQAALNDTAEEFEEVANRSEESADLLDEQAEKLTGALAAIGAGLGLAATALLSKLPIVDEAAAGLEAILTSLILKIDEEVRPGLNDLGADFFDLAEDINKAESAAAAIGITLGGLGDILAENILRKTEGLTVEQTVDFAIRVGQVAVDTSGLKEQIRSGRITINLSNLLRFIGEFGIPQVAVSNFVREIGQRITTALIGQAQSIISSFTTRLTTGLQTTTSRIISGLQTTAEKVRKQFKNIWQQAETATKKQLNSITATVEEQINRIIRAINQIPGLDFGLISLPRFDVSDGGGGGGGSGSGGPSGAKGKSRGGPPPATAPRTDSTTIEVDGRTLGRTASRHSGEGVANRGR